MKKFIGVLTALALSLSACAESKNIDGKTYEPYGLVNESTKKNDKVCYETVVGNVFWSIVLIETIVMPIYFFGFSINEPVKMKDANGNCSVD